MLTEKNTRSPQPANPWRVSKGALALLSAALASLLSTGCASIGPQRARASHIEYNQEIAKSQEAQLLLNLVRLRYGDTPFFIEVTTITSSYTFNATASAAGTLAHGQAASGSAGMGVGWTDNPSVTFIPFGGDKFARALLSPIPLETLLLLPRNGWSIERVMLCCVQSLNGVLNEPGAAGPTPSYQPVYKDFNRVARLL
ncbi:MAG TPA: hypothetical protein VFC23_11635, partial [Thermoanaerobaculia bacterium]|nr:hypothetical protein [Thermoanaerobaculia bacterium]